MNWQPLGVIILAIKIRPPVACADRIDLEAIVTDDLINLATLPLQGIVV
jgi:hypothetical protein